MKNSPHGHICPHTFGAEWKSQGEVEITGNTCTANEEGVMSTFPCPAFSSQLSVVSLEGFHTTQGCLGLHSGGSLELVDKGIIGELRARRESEWVMSVGRPYWKADALLGIWALNCLWLLSWLVWSSVGTGHPHNGTVCPGSC